MSLVVLQQVEASLEEALHEALLYLLLRPEQVDILLQNLPVHALECPLARDRDRVELLLPPVLLVSSVLFGHSSLAFRQIGLLEVLKLAEVGEEPGDEVDVGGEGVLYLDCKFALGVLPDQLRDRRAAQKVERGPLEHLRAVHQIDQVFEARLKQIEHLFANVGGHVLQVKQN